MATVDILDELIPDDEFCRQIKRTPRTLQRWDRLGIGPTPTMIGSSKYRHIDDIRTWLKAQRREAPRGRPAR